MHYQAQLVSFMRSPTSLKYYFALFLLCPGTRVWVTADCKRTTNASAKSNGTVNFGLFEYEANLNWGLGDRPTRKQMLGPEGVMYHERQVLLGLILLQILKI